MGGTGGMDGGRMAREDRQVSLDGQDGELRIGRQSMRLTGRALRLILWLAHHQARINETAPESGQIWLSWKGDGQHSIAGDIRTRL